MYQNICQLSLNHFNNLPRSGKPKPSEWTVLATITKSNVINDNLEVVALGTGSKCIGISKMSSNGDILNDSHGEVICRRAFLRYLLEEIEKCYEDCSEIFSYDEKSGLCLLKNNFEFHFFTTQVPCGDASIFSTVDEDFGRCLSEEFEGGHKNKKMKIEINITGAKCLSQIDSQHLKSRYVNAEVVGRVRTKPGRGSPTLSVSCSDKLAKWCHLGLQGSLISQLLKEPIYMKSLIIASKLFDKFAMYRSLYGRFDEKLMNDVFSDIEKVEIVPLQENFHFSKSNCKTPCSSSIVWCKTKHNFLEVAVEGRRQGTTKKAQKSKTSRLKICKMEIYRHFVEIVGRNKIFPVIFFNKNQTYLKSKLNSECYQKKWKYLKDHGFKTWTRKNEMLEEFVLD